MKTAEEWLHQFDIRRRTNGTWRETVLGLLRDALAERDAEVERARRDERLARCQLGDHLQEYHGEWERIRRAALEEVRGRVRDVIDREIEAELSSNRPDSADAVLGDYAVTVLARVEDSLTALGTARDPLPPTRAEEGLEALREGVRALAAATAHEGPIPAHLVARRLRELLGEVE